jgi:hypothetical protein
VTCYTADALAHAAVPLFDHLPRALLARVPELSGPEGPGGSEEPRADCTRCVMAPASAAEDPGAPWAFAENLRCCTHHPALPNFLVGRILRRGGAGAARVHARLEELAGVSAWGIRPPRPAPRPIDLEQRFGRDPDLLCPFWIGGALACGIWTERTGSCRTWFCRHEQGLHGARRWWRRGDVLGALEARLGSFLVTEGGAGAGSPPPAPDAPVAALLAWYEQCATRVDRFDAADAARIDLDGLAPLRSELVALRVRPPDGLPEVLVPAVSAMHEEPGGVRIAGYSSYDAIVAPRAVLAFFGRLDGTRTWRQALTGAPELDESTVRELYRIGALEPPADR